MDLARAWAVTAMVMGHTLEATLLLAERETPLVAAYWPWRSLTAPLFLMVSGWALALLFSRHPLSGWGHLKERLPRIGALFGLGLLLRFPTWAADRLFAGDPEILAHFFALDVLQLIAVCLLMGSLLAGLRTQVSARLFLATLFGLVIVVASPAVWSMGSGHPRSWGLVFGGGVSPFSLLPWAAYFLVGMAVGYASQLTGTGRRRTVILLLAGAMMTGITWLSSGAFLPQPAVPGPALFVHRCGLVLMALGMFGRVPSAWGRWLAPLGRRALSIYFFHLLIVYGGLELSGLTHWVGRTLTIGQSLALGVSVLMVSVGFSYVWSALRWASIRGWIALRTNGKIRGRIQA